MIIALAGQQNSGKTTVFNALTGSNQHVGNFPGVTVDRKEGIILNRKDMTLVDLPGIYSLRPFTQEEIVSRDMLLFDKPDGIINVVDATNIERNLYLTLQILELKKPTVIALNMIDEVRKNGGYINCDKLSEKLGVPVVPISALKNEGIDDLCSVLFKTVTEKRIPKVQDFCADGPVHRCIHSTIHIIEDHARNADMPVRFSVMKIIEGDKAIIDRLRLDQNEIELIEHNILQMEKESGFERNEAVADMRYGFIENVISECIEVPFGSKEHERSVAIDKILTGKFTAIPVFILIMGISLYCSFDLIGGNLQDLLANLIGIASAKCAVLLERWQINPVLQSLVIDGLFEGVGSVLSFLPIVVTMFFFLSMLEDSGYMARIAFVMDSLLRKIGLSGKSFCPLLIGFGCSVPAIMSARTMSSERDRKMTILLIPFMSCSAKIPVYAVLASAFFRKGSIWVIMLTYFFGIFCAIVVSSLYSRILFKGKPNPFVMELPNYRLPGFKNVMILLWEKASDFLERAFGIIFSATLVIWFLTSFNIRFYYVSDPQESILAMVGNLIAPLFKPLGFGHWQLATSLFTGFIAKESVISTLAVLLNVEMSGVSEAISGFLSLRSGISYLVFILLYTPCVAAVGTLKKEFGSIWQAIGISLLQCAIAWVVSFFVFSLLGIVL